MALLPDINFREIRSWGTPPSQAGGFEELVSQLMREGLIGFPTGTRFERFGNPDGGREGRGILPNGAAGAAERPERPDLRHRRPVTQLQAQLTALDQKLTDANIGLLVLQAEKGANKDAVAAQKKVVTGLQGQLGSIQNQIRSIDGQIAQGCCVA